MGIRVVIVYLHFSKIYKGQKILSGEKRRVVSVKFSKYNDLLKVVIPQKLQ